jgi:hypothetical protein
MRIRLRSRRERRPRDCGGNISSAVHRECQRRADGQVAVAGAAVGWPIGINCCRWRRELVASVGSKHHVSSRPEFGDATNATKRFRTEKQKVDNVRSTASDIAASICRSRMPTQGAYEWTEHRRN